MQSETKWTRRAIIATFIASLIGASGCGNARSNTPGTGGVQGGTTCVAATEPSRGERISLLSGPWREATEAISWRPPGGISRDAAGILFVSGVDGGFVEPADGIYSRIAEKYSARGIPSIFVRYRQPGELEPSVDDALAAAALLRSQGVKRIAILGWSFGGAVITNAAVRIPETATVMGFAPQAKDTEAVAGFRSQSLLLFHSDEDENVPIISSQQILDEAPEGIRKELFPIAGADHLLTGVGDRIGPVVFQWLESELRLEAHCS